MISRSRGVLGRPWDPGGRPWGDLGIRVVSGESLGRPTGPQGVSECPSWFLGVAGADALTGQLTVLFVLGVAAAEAAVGLALFIALFRNRRTIDIDRINLMRW